MVRLLKLLLFPWSTSRRALLSVGLLLLLGGAGGIVGFHLWWNSHLRAAQHALEQRDYTAAWEHLSRLLRVRSADGQVQFLAARTARLTFRWDEARAHLAVCRNLHWSEDALVLEEVLIRVQCGDPRGEDFLRERVAEGHPDSLLILEVLIQEYVRTYRLWEALHALNDFLQRRPDDVQALLGRAWVWEKLFYFADAQRDCQRAVEVAPDNLEAHRRLAEVLLVHGTAAEAAEHFAYLLNRQPGEPRFLLGLARCKRTLGEGDKVRPLLAAIPEGDPHHVEALTLLGQVALDENRPAEAVTFLRQAVAADPQNLDALTHLHTALQLTGQEQEARKCKAVLEQVRADLPRLDDLTRKALRNPNDPDLRCQIGVIFLRHGLETEGLRWLNLALELQPGYRPAHEALADYYEKHGQPDRAAQHRRVVQKGGSPRDARNPGEEGG